MFFGGAGGQPVDIELTAAQLTGKAAFVFQEILVWLGRIERKRGGSELREMALPKAKEIVSSNPVVVFRSAFNSWIIFFLLLLEIFVLR